MHDEDLQTIEVPTLLISGQRSPRLFHLLLDRLEELIPDTQRVQIPDASHIMHEDNVAAYNAAVRTLLAAHRAT